MPQWDVTIEQQNLYLHGKTRKITILYFLVEKKLKKHLQGRLLNWWTSGPSCSKLTTSLVNDSLKFTLRDTQICWNFLLKKMWVATHIFSAKNIRILYIESTKTVNEMILNELIKLTTIWTTGPWIPEVTQLKTYTKKFWRNSNVSSYLIALYKRDDWINIVLISAQKTYTVVTYLLIRSASVRCF